MLEHVVTFFLLICFIIASIGVLNEQLNDDDDEDDDDDDDDELLCILAANSCKR